MTRREQFEALAADVLVDDGLTRDVMKWAQVLTDEWLEDIERVRGLIADDDYERDESARDAAWQSALDEARGK